MLGRSRLGRLGHGPTAAGHRSGTGPTGAGHPAGPEPTAAFAGLVTAALAVTTVTNLAPLLSSGLAVQILEDLHFDETALGLTIGSFYLAGALGSALSGRIVDRVGPRASLRFTAAATAAMLLGAGALSRSWAVLTAFVALAGLTNAFAQPATNLYIARGVHPGRQGIAIGIQKSGVPTASLLGGLAVPTLGLTIGWNWAFVFGAILALAASLYVPSTYVPSTYVPSTLPKPGGPLAPAQATPGRPSAPAQATPAGPEPGWAKPAGPEPAQAAPAADKVSARPDVPTRLLALLATATGLGAAGSGSLGGFFVVSGVEIGFDEAVAGILLMVGSVIGIVTRLALGVAVDRGSVGAWSALTVMFLVAAAAFGGLATGSKTTLIAVLPFAFATAFAWPSVYHLAVVRANPSAPGAATGITMTGSFTGAVSGPLIFGVLAETASYGWAWSFTMISMTAAAAVMTVVGRRIDNHGRLSSTRTQPPGVEAGR